MKIDPRGGCFRPFETTRIVDCVVPLSSGLVRAGLGNNDDRLEPVDPDTSFGFSVEGDLGNDVLIGTHKRDVLDGVGGDDIDCGEDWGDDDLGIFNTDDTVSNCERIRHEL